MTRPAQAPTLRHARAAVFALFASFGIVLSTWAVHLPALKQSVGMSNAMTGTVLLILGIGSLAGMQISGVAIESLGDRARRGDGRRGPGCVDHGAVGRHDHRPGRGRSVRVGCLGRMRRRRNERGRRRC